MANVMNLRAEAVNGNAAWGYATQNTPPLVGQLAGVASTRLFGYYAANRARGVVYSGKKVRSGRTLPACHSLNPGYITQRDNKRNCMEADTMRKAKRGPALFELLSKDTEENSDRLIVPTWWAGQDRGSAAGVIKLASHAKSITPTREEAVVDEGGKPPFLAFTEGCICISLTSTLAAGAVFVALTTLLVVFEFGSRRGFADGVLAGRATYAAEAASEIDLARQQPPATHLVESLLSDPGSKGEPKKNSATRTGANWIRDYTYIVAQEFARGREQDARKAQAFLAMESIETALVPQPSGSVQLITTQGFNHRDSSQKRMAIQSLEKEHRIGEQFYAQGGGYRLKGYFKKLKGDRW